jgi:hypothetical protein
MLGTRTSMQCRWGLCPGVGRLLVSGDRWQVWGLPSRAGAGQCPDGKGGGQEQPCQSSNPCSRYIGQSLF